MNLYHVVEFYYDFEENLCEVYRGIFSDVPKNMSFTTQIDCPIAIKSYPAEINKAVQFSILDGLLLKSSDHYTKGIERGYWK